MCIMYILCLKYETLFHGHAHLYSGKLHTQLTGVEWSKCAENATVNCTLKLIDPVLHITV